MALHVAAAHRFVDDRTFVLHFNVTVNQRMVPVDLFVLHEGNVHFFFIQVRERAVTLSHEASQRDGCHEPPT